LENWYSVPDHGGLVKIAEFFNVSQEYLLGSEGAEFEQLALF
jgi:hypothetical protein